MKFLPTKSRRLLPLLIVAGFFIPAYKSVSAFQFILLALQEAKLHSDITISDALMIVVPLGLVPVTAIGIFIRAVLKLRIRTTITSLPALMLFFSVGILSLSGTISGHDVSFPSVLIRMQAGFYIVAIASLLLIATKDQRRRRVRKMKASETFVTEETEVAQPLSPNHANDIGTVSFTKSASKFSLK